MLPAPLQLPAGVVELSRQLSDVAALQNDPPVQRQTLIDGLIVILNAKLGWFYVVDNWLPGLTPKLTCQVLNSDAEPLWLQYMAEFAVKNPPMADPFSARSLFCNDTRQVWTRAAVLPDRETELKFRPCLELVEKLHTGDGMACAYRHGVGTARVVGFAVHRDKNQPAFTPLEQSLAAFALDELADMEARGLLPLRDATSPAIAPRLEQVLDRLLAGKNARDIAHDLRISLHTVNEHIQRVYKHFEVASRQELMSKFIRGDSAK